MPAREEVLIAASLLLGRRDRFLPAEADGDLSALVLAHAVGDVGPAEADGDLS